MSESANTLRNAILGIGLASFLFAAADFAYEKHPHVDYEAWFNFYGFFALVVSFALVSAARLLKASIGRDEDFYDG